MYNVKTIDNDEEFLRKKSSEVAFYDVNYKDEIEVLKQFCIERETFAVSAVQLGVSKRIIYLNKNEEKAINKIIINPRVMYQKGKSEYWEACSSVPNKIGLVERFYEIELEYYDENNENKKEVFNGLDATIIQHELDHLDGILFIDKAKKILNMTLEERKEFRKKHPYCIISKD